MKKIYVLGVVSILALSLLLAGCGGTKSDNATDKQNTKQTQNMNNMNMDNNMNGSGDMSNTDHSKMNMNDNKQ